MLRLPQGFLLSGVACALVLAVGLVAWALATSSSEAQSGSMHNCPSAGKWAISVWEGPDGTETDAALATCAAVPVMAAYYLDPETQSWSRWFAGKPDVSNLTTLNNMQGILALGATPTPSATPTPTPTSTPSASEIQTPLGALVIKEVQVTDRMPPDCNLDVPKSCSAIPEEGYHFLYVWLEWKDGSSPGLSEVLELSKDEPYVIASDGSRGDLSMGGVSGDRMYFVFAPPASAHDFWLYWPGNARIDLGI
jgi:hypothetical protein